MVLKERKTTKTHAPPAGGNSPKEKDGKFTEGHEDNQRFNVLFGLLLAVSSGIFVRLFLSGRPGGSLEDNLVASSAATLSEDGRFRFTHLNAHQLWHDRNNRTYWLQDPPRFLWSSGSCALQFSEGTPMTTKEFLELDSRSDDDFLFLLNSENDGMILKWNPGKNPECFYEAAVAAAVELGVPRELIESGIRPYSFFGKPMTSGDVAKQDKNIAYILVDQQVWMWPGVEKGFVYKLEDGVVLETASLWPRVFKVKNFFSRNEAKRILELGTPLLAESTIVNDGKRKKSGGRTSSTAYLEQSSETKEMQYRTANVLRYPNPMMAETLQLTRYEGGQFYKPHHDFFMHIDPVNRFQSAEVRLQRWFLWAQQVVNFLGDSAPDSVKVGGPLFPSLDNSNFEQNMLKIVLQASPPICEDSYMEWLKSVDELKGSWLMHTVNTRRDIFYEVVDQWQMQAGYIGPPYRAADAGIQLFRWYRWAKDVVASLGSSARPEVRVNGDFFPSFQKDAQLRLAQKIVSANVFSNLSPDSRQWFLSAVRSGASQILFSAVQRDPGFLPVITEVYQRIGGPEFVYRAPVYVLPIEPNRYATIFMYLSDVARGGETGFPTVMVPPSDGKSQADGDCYSQLAVKSVQTEATLFYHQHSDGALDPMSLHQGCPPLDNTTKYGANSFTWNVDYIEAVDLWGLGAESHA